MIKIISWLTPTKAKNWNRRIYKQKNLSFNLASFTISDNPVERFYVYSDMDSLHSIENIVGKVGVVDYRPDGLWIDVEWIPTQTGKNCVEGLETGFYGIKPFGYGKSDATGYVTEFQLRGFALTAR